MFTQQYGDDTMELAMTISWVKWTNRNEKRYRGRPKSGLDVLHWCEMLISNFKKANSKVDIARPVCVQGWRPPVPPSYKVNVDDAIFLSQHEARVVFVFRDGQGLVMAALSKNIKQPLSPLEIKAKALKEGILFARDIGIQEFVLEGDSQVVVDAITSYSHPPSSIALVCSLSHEFREVEVSHTHRDKNVPAHLLTKYALGVKHYVTWIEESPCLLEYAISNDVISFCFV